MFKKNKSKDPIIKGQESDIRPIVKPDIKK